MRNSRQNSNSMLRKYKIILFSISVAMVVGLLYLAFVDVEVKPVLVEEEIKIDFAESE